jgi:hypothetical protein
MTRLALLKLKRDSQRKIASVHQAFDLSAEDVVIVFRCPASCQLYYPTRTWTLMHHLPISKKSQGAVFCNDAWVDEGVRGGGSARRSSLISLVIFGRVWETICGARHPSSPALERMSARNHAPSRQMFCWIPRAVVQRGDEDNRASDAARAATFPDAGTKPAAAHGSDCVQLGHHAADQCTDFTF